MDQFAGPHIVFEQQGLYPRLSELGEQNATEALLVDQHHDAVQCVLALLQLDARHASPAVLHTLTTGFEEAPAHAKHCGTLISLMPQRV